MLLCAFSDSAPPLLAITCQTDLQFPADPGVDFSRAYGTDRCVGDYWGAADDTTLRKFAAHQDSCEQTLPHRHFNRPDLLETECLIESLSAQRRKDNQFAYVEMPGIAEAASKQIRPNAPPHQVWMGSEVTDVRFPFDDFSAFRTRRRPASASDKIAWLGLCNVVCARCEQLRVGLSHMRQGAEQRFAA